MTNHLFELAGNRKTETVIPKSKKKWYQGKPVVSAAILILIVLGCLCAELIMTKDPAYMDLLKNTHISGSKVEGEAASLHLYH